MSTRIWWLVGAVATAILGAMVRIMLSEVQFASELFWFLLVAAIGLLIMAAFGQRPRKTREERELEEIKKQAQESVKRAFDRGKADRERKKTN